MPVFEVTGPDGTVYEVTGPEGSTQEEAIARAQAMAGQQPTPADVAQEPVRGTLLPFERSADGELSFAVPEIGQAMIDAVKLPGDVFSGETPVRDEAGNINPEVVERSFDLGGIASPATAGARGAKAATKSIPVTQGQQVAASGQRLGVPLPRGVTTDSPAIQQTGKVITNVPIAGNPLRNAAREAVQGLDDVARTIQDDLGTGSRQVAGAAVRDDIATHIDDVIKVRVSNQYDLVDDLVDPSTTRPLSATRRVADEIVSKRREGAIGGQGRAVKVVREALDRPEGLSYEGLRRLRTEIGGLLENPSALPAGTSQAELKRIYGALTDDLRATVAQSGGGKALQQFNNANKFAARMAKERENLQKILGRDTSDEGIFERIIGMASGKAKGANINRLDVAKRAVSSDTWNEIASASLARMGRGPDGAFTPDRFLTAYGNMSPAGRRAIFGRKTVAQLDDIARVSTRFKQLNEFANPSGTAQSTIGPGAAFALLTNPLETTTALVGTNVMSRLLAKPNSAKQVAEWANALEVSVVKPSSLASARLQNRSQVLALTLARESGAMSLAPQFAARLNGVAEEDVQDNNGQGSQINSPDQGQPRQYDPRFDL